ALSEHFLGVHGPFRVFRFLSAYFVDGVVASLTLTLDPVEFRVACQLGSSALRDPPHEGGQGSRLRLQPLDLRRDVDVALDRRLVVGPPLSGNYGHFVLLGGRCPGYPMTLRDAWLPNTSFLYSSSVEGLPA